MSKRAFPWLLLILSLAYLLIGVNRNVSHYDEGLITVDALRVLAGQMPVRDFWSYYAPGQYYLVAGWFRLLGPSILHERLLAVLLAGLLLTLLYLLAQRLGAGRWALLAWLVGVAWMGLPLVATNLVTSLLCGLASCYCWVVYLDGGAVAWGLLAGLAAGLTTLFRHDLGVYTLLGQSVVMLAYHAQARRGWPSLGLYWLGYAALVAPVVGIFLAQVPHAVLRYDYLDFPRHVYPVVRYLPYPTPWGPLRELAAGHLGAGLRDFLDDFPFWLAPTIYVLALAGLVTGHRRGRVDWATPAPWGFLLVGAVGLLYAGMAAVRRDVGHLMPTALPAGVMLAVLVRHAWPAPPAPRARRWLLGALLALALAALLAHPVFTRLHLLADLALHGPGPTFDLPRARGMVIAPEDGPYQAVVEWVRANVPPGEPIFVGAYRHDLLFINEVTLYFLAEHPPATRYEDLVPGTATTAPVQQEIIGDLQASHVRFVLRAYQEIPPGEHVGPPGSHLLDDYLARNFVLVCSWPGYAAYVRGDALAGLRLTPCPAP